MTKLEFMDEIYFIVEEDREAFYNDKGAIRMLFHEHKHFMQLEGMLSNSQANNWILTAGELQKCLTIARRCYNEY